jgi:WbqC-like protein
MRLAKSIVILQSNYLPWKGYFDLMASVDEFLIFDEVQYTRRDWRNRNRIVVQGKVQWLTIPVRTKGQYLEAIERIEIDGHDWAPKHWETIRHAYKRADFFAQYESTLQDAYERAAKLALLTEVNELFLRRLSEIIDLNKPLLRTSAAPRTSEQPTDRLVEICMARDATEYVSGPAARSYIEREKFAAAGVRLRYAQYPEYPRYDQRSETFEHGVSLIDVIMRCGPEARCHLKSLEDRESFLSGPLDAGA